LILFEQGVFNISGSVTKEPTITVQPIGLSANGGESPIELGPPAYESSNERGGGHTGAAIPMPYYPSDR